MTLIAALIVLSILTWACWPQNRAVVRPLTATERLVAWELRMGKHRAEQRVRDHRIQASFDYRASVQPKVSPKLPKDNVVELRRIAK